MINIAGKKTIILNGVKLVPFIWRAINPRCKYCACTSNKQNTSNLKGYCLFASVKSQNERIDCRIQKDTAPEVKYILLTRESFRRVKREHKLLVQQEK